MEAILWRHNHPICNFFFKIYHIGQEEKNLQKFKYLKNQNDFPYFKDVLLVKYKK